MNAQWTIGVIAGSGLYAPLGLPDAELRDPALVVRDAAVPIKVLGWLRQLGHGARAIVARDHAS